MVRANIKIEKVCDAPPHDTVEDVAECASQNQSETGERIPVEPIRAPKDKAAHQHHGRHRKQHQQRGAPLGSGIVKQTESDATVLGMDEIEKSRNDANRVEKRDMG